MLNKRYLSFRVIKVSTWLCTRIIVYWIVFVKVTPVWLNLFGSNIQGLTKELFPDLFREGYLDLQALTLNERVCRFPSVYTHRWIREHSCGNSLPTASKVSGVIGRIVLTTQHFGFNSDRILKISNSQSRYDQSGFHPYACETAKRIQCENVQD